MTPDQADLIFSLVQGGSTAPISSEEFLREFGAADGVALGLELLRDAVERQDPVDVELAKIVCFHFGFSQSHLPLLESLAFADWHKVHEDVASALGKLRSPTSVNALLHLAEWVPDYLDFDEFRALATKAIWALGAITGEAAQQALERLSVDDDSIVSRGAREQLDRRERA